MVVPLIICRDKLKIKRDRLSTEHARREKVQERLRTAAQTIIVVATALMAIGVTSPVAVCAHLLTRLQSIAVDPVHLYWQPGCDIN